MREPGRIRRERATVRAMIALYCEHHHGGGPCEDCRELAAYADRRIDRCFYGPDKPTCVRCPIHCYAARRRERIREVMRFAGPRMVWRHPVLALLHFLDGRSKKDVGRPPAISDAARDSRPADADAVDPKPSPRLGGRAGRRIAAPSIDTPVLRFSAMEKGHRLQVDEERLEELCRRYGIRRLAIFGSVLRDDFGPDSDVDVLVELEPGVRVGFVGLGEIENALSELFGRRVDLRTPAELSPHFRDQVLRAAETRYAAG